MIKQINLKRNSKCHQYTKYNLPNKKSLINITDRYLNNKLHLSYIFKDPLLYFKLI